MDNTLIIVGVVIIAVLGLGAIARMFGRADLQAKERLREEKENERRSAKWSRDTDGAFDAPKWWERGKARDQKAYFEVLHEVKKGEASPTAVHALSRVYEGERKRRQRMRTVIGMLVLVGWVFAAAFLLAPRETVRAFELFAQPALTVAAGVCLFMFGMSDRIQKTVGGVLTNVFAAVVFSGALVTLLAGLVLGVWAAFSW